MRQHIVHSSEKWSISRKAKLLSAEVRFGSILKHAGHSQTTGRSQSNKVKGKGDRKDFLETKSTEQTPVTKRIIQFAIRKGLAHKGKSGRTRTFISLLSA